MNELLDFIFISGILINIIILFLLSKNLKTDISKRILFIFFLISLMTLLHSYAELHQFIPLYALTFLPAEMIEWLFGPILLYYIQSIFNKGKFREQINLKHLIPALIIFCFITLPIFIYLLTDYLAFSYLEILMEYAPYYIYIRDLYFISYLIYNYLLLNRIKKLLNAYYSDDKEQAFRWIQYLLIGALVLMSIDIATEIYEQVFGDFKWNIGFVTISGMVTLFAFLGYFGIEQSSILLPNFLWTFERPTTEKETKNIHPEQEDQQEILYQFMATQKPYLDENLTLSQLANMIETTDKKLSLLLNQHLNKSFYDYINEYRIQHFVELLKTDKLQSQTIFALAQESGFRSKATFNRVFKKYYHCAPSVFIKQNN